MRIVITFTSEGRVRLPINYNEVLQGFIYSHLDGILAGFLHEEGFRCGSRSFKLFTFSRLIGKVRASEGMFNIRGPFKLIVSSPHREMLQSLAECILKSPEVDLANNPLIVQSIEVKFTPPVAEDVVVEMLSPVTVYSTLHTPEGRKKTYYYNPREREFTALCRENILKKYRAFYGRGPEDTDFSIEPLRVSKRDEKIVTYKGFVIKGWMGRYRLSGNPELLRLAYDAGIGAKNSQGFGCFEVVGR